MKKFIKKLLGKTITSLLMPYINRRKEEKRTVFYSQFIKEGDLCFDIGANIGNRTKPFLNLKAKVVAVEPQSACCKILRDNFGASATIVQKGVGDQRGELDFFEADSTMISSFSEEWIEEVKKDRFKEYSWNKPIKVEVTTLDDLISEYGKPAFVKIDVEGYELNVLKGLNQPVRCLSFEYTVPEQTDHAIECIKQFQKVSPKATFNYSPRESLKIAFTDWVDIDTMCALIKSDKFAKTLAGDIYARSNQ